MPNRFDELSNQATWLTLVDAAKKGAEAAGYVLSRVPGRGRSNLWRAERDGKTQIASIRTTRDRWIAFPPLEGGSRWKTLDEVDLVFVAAVDRREGPRSIEVYVFQADEVRQRFAAAYAARIKAGYTIKDNFGMWVSLDSDERGIPSSVGSGLADEHEPVSVYRIEELLAAGDGSGGEPEAEEVVIAAPDEVEQPWRPSTIAEVVVWARERIAEIAGVRPDAIKVDLKIEY